MDIQKSINHEIYNLSNERICRTDQDSNEDQCFACHKSGKLECCDRCPKAFHLSCSRMKKHDNIWQCQYCHNQGKCQFCDKITSSDSKLIRCTICHSAAHQSCLSQTRFNYNRYMQLKIPLKEYTYTCKRCLNSFGVKIIDQTLRIKQTSNYFDIFQSLQCLVRINTKSPIHYGLYDDLSINQSAEQIKKIFRNDRNIKKLHQLRKLQVQSMERIQIQKIIAIKIPIKYQNKSFYQLYKILSDEERRKSLQFGNKDNFYFYVKWNDSPYEHCTWQSEIVIHKLSQKQHLIFQFLKDQENTLKQLPLLQKFHDKNVLTQQKLRHFQQIQLYAASMFRLSSYRCLYHLQLIDYESDSIVNDISIYLNHIYIIQQQTQPSILVIEKEKISFWQDVIKQKCKYLNILSLKESQKGIDIILKREYYLTNTTIRKYHVMLVTYENFIKYSQNIINKTDKHAVILFNKFHFTSFFNYFKNNKKQLLCSANHFIFTFNHSNVKLDEKNISNIIQYLSSNFKNSFLMRYTHNQNKIQVIEPFSKDYKEDKGINKSSQIFKYCRKYPLKQSKQFALLRYLLKFGILTNDIDDLYKRLNIFAPQVYDVPKLNQWQRDIFSGYVNSFIILLTISQDIVISSELKKQYFFDIDPKVLMERLILLHCLNNKVQKGSTFDLPQLKIKLIYNNNEQRQVYLTSWSREDDRLLAKLIVRHGFGSWDEICQDIKWKRQDGSQRYNFGHHLKFKCILQHKAKPVDLYSIIKTRCIQILTYSSYSNIDDYS